MKNIFFIVFMLCCFNATAQIPNGDFENWTLSANNILEPDGWSTGNYWSVYKFNYLTVERTSDAYQGNWALKLKPYIRDSNYAFNVLSGIAMGNVNLVLDTLHSCQPYGDTIPINYVFKKMTGYYKFIKDSTLQEKIQIGLSFQTFPNYTFAVGGSEDFLYSDTFRYFEIPIVYYDTLNGPPYYQPSNFTLHITYFSKNSSHTPNSYIIFDDLQTSGSYTNVLDVPIDKYVKIYPNPATDFLKVMMLEATTIRAYSIYALNGQLLQSALYHNAPIDIRKLSAGNYIIQFATSKGLGSLRFEKL